MKILQKRNETFVKNIRGYDIDIHTLLPRSIVP